MRYHQNTWNENNCFQGCVAIEILINNWWDCKSTITLKNVIFNENKHISALHDSRIPRNVPKRSSTYIHKKMRMDITNLVIIAQVREQPKCLSAVEWVRSLGLACAHYSRWNGWPTNTCCIAQRTLPNILWWSEKKRIWKRIDVCTCIPESLCCTTEIITTL